MVPAERSDLDHQVPWPVGPTEAADLWALCRRHHRMKSHGFLGPPLSVEEEEMMPEEEEMLAVPSHPGAEADTRRPGREENSLPGLAHAAENQLSALPLLSPLPSPLGSGLASTPASLRCWAVMGAGAAVSGS